MRWDGYISKGAEIGKFKHRKPRNQSEIDGHYGLPMLDGSVVFMTCNLKYINHAKKPNVTIYDDFSICANRNIKAGEELFSHYGQEWVDLQNIQV